MRVERRLVLGLHRDQVLALGLVELGRALEREVDRFGRARGPDQVLRVAAHQRGDLLARLLDRLLGLPAEGVRAARRVAEVLGQVRDHLLRHARIDRRGRGVIQVDGQLQRRRHQAATFSAGRSAAPCADASRPRKSLITCTCLALLVRDHVGERDRAQVVVHLLVQRRPQVVRHAAPVVEAVLLAAALRRVDRLVHRADDVGHRDVWRSAWPGNSRRPGRARCSRAWRGAACRTAAPGRTAKCAGAR